MNQFGVAILVVNIVFLALAAIFVALRFISAAYIVRRVALSDYVILLSLALTSGLTASNIAAATKGLGWREGVLETWKLPLALAEYVFTVLYVC